jgi:hypothetical protein
MMRVSCLVMLVAAGCLADPTGRHGDGGADMGVGLTDMPLHGDALVGAGTPFPPAGTTALRLGTVGDLNQDGKNDLVLLDATPGHVGLYVLLGRSSGIGSVYDSFMPTTVQPLAAATLLAAPGAAPSVVALAVDGNGDAVLLAFDGAPDGGLKMPFSTPLPFKPDVASPNLYVTIARFTQTGLPGIVVGDDNGGWSGQPTNWPNTDGASFVQLPKGLCGSNGPSDTMGVVAVPRSDGLDDLLMVRFDCLSYFHNDGSGVFVNGVQKLTWSQTDHQYFGGQEGMIYSFTEGDIDGDGVPDVLGGIGHLTAFPMKPLLAVVATGNATPPAIPEPVVHPIESLNAPRFGGLAAQNMDKDTRNELLWLDPYSNSDAGVLAQVGCYVDVSFNGDLDMGVVGARDPLFYKFPSLSPAFFAAGRFRGLRGGEVVAFSSTGASQCVQMDVNGLTLESCR